MFWSASFFYWHIFHSSGFHHICNIKCRLECRYSPQNIFHAKNFNPHKKPMSLLNVPICTQSMQRTWWPEYGTIIVTGPYSLRRSDIHKCLLSDNSLLPVHHQYIIWTNNKLLLTGHTEIYFSTIWRIVQHLPYKISTWIWCLPNAGHIYWNEQGSEIGISN